MKILINSDINNELEKYIQENNIQDINLFCNNILKLGFECYKKQSNNSLLTNINEIINNNNQNLYKIIDEIKNNTNEIKCNFSKPTKQGIYGENIINNYINDLYPNDIITDTSNIPHSGDYHLYLTDINEKIIIEVKNYSYLVPKNQINKLIYDMKCTGINYAIFISLSSKIIGKKNNIEFELFKESNKDNIIIFITFIDNLQIGINILKILINLLNQQDINKNKLMYINNFTKQSYDNINNNINELILLKDNINKIKNNIFDLHNTISKQILDVYHSFTIFDNEYNNKLKLFQIDLTYEFSNIINIIDNKNNEDIYLFIDNYKKSKIYDILQLIISDLISLNFNIIINSKNELQINTIKNIEYGKINILKTNINIILLCNTSSINNEIQLKNINIYNWINIKSLFQII